MNNTQVQILQVFKIGAELSSGDIFNLLKSVDISQITIKRHLTDITDMGYLTRLGKGRSVKYKLSGKGVLLRPYNVIDYLAKNEQERNGQKTFNFDIFQILNSEIFTAEEIKSLSDATSKFRKNKENRSEVIHKKELERFVIELSWKSSAIEGNTYSLLDTELLLKEGIKSNKNTESETQMILNHKKAFDFIFTHKDYFQNLSIKKIEEVHYLLTDNLGIQKNLRKYPVGVTGTSYRPLDNEFQIKEALQALCNEINKIEDVFSKALLLILGVSYIQPFEDGNKRTSRLIGNAILIANNFAPLSYRTVDVVNYRAASLIFYEQNSLQAFKEIFIEQYIFACENYNIA